MRKIMMNVMKKVFVGGMLACMLLTAVNVNSDAGVEPIGAAGDFIEEYR